MPKFLIKERASTTKPELKLFILYILLIIIAETITYLANAVWGILIHASLLISLLVLSALSYGSNPSHRLFLSLALAPVIRITSLSLPTQLTPPMRYLFSGILILTAAATLIKVQGLRPHEVGLTLEKPLVQAVIPFTGIPLGIIEYQILKPPILASNLPINQWIALALAIIFSTGFVEELVFRGIIQNSAIQALGTKTGLLGASIIFAALHIGWYSIPDLVFVFSAGLFFGILVLKTRSILGVSLSHGIVNILLFMILPIQ